MDLNHNRVNLDYNERTTLRILIKKEVEILRKLIEESDDKLFVKNYNKELGYLEGIFNKLAY